VEKENKKGTSGAFPKEMRRGSIPVVSIIEMGGHVSSYFYYGVNSYEKQNGSSCGMDYPFWLKREDSAEEWRKKTKKGTSGAFPKEMRRGSIP